MVEVGIAFGLLILAPTSICPALYQRVHRKVMHQFGAECGGYFL